MFQKTLLLAVTLTTCWAKSAMLAEDKIPTALHWMDRTLITFPGASLENNVSSTFSCNGEGFYSHSSDCTKFYRCIDVTDNNDYLQLAFKCHAGTIFSPDNKSCISGTCSTGILIRRSLAASTKAIKDQAEDVFDANINALNDDVFEALIRGEFWESNTNLSLICNSEGRFEHPHDCGKFYNCLPNDNGGFVAHQRSCFGNAFHPTKKACVAPREVEGCFPNSSRSLNPEYARQIDLDTYCSGYEYKFICEDCKTLIMCAAGTTYSETCESGHFCLNSDDFGGGVCYPNKPKECTCTQFERFTQDPHNEAKFLSCDSVGKDPYIYMCANNGNFEVDTQTCSFSDSGCPPSGSFAANVECSRYFIFIFTTEGWVHKELTCPMYKMYNDDTSLCENPCDWYTDYIQKFKCLKEGRFENPFDCEKYFKCIQDPYNKNGFIAVEKQCRNGYAWFVVDSDEGYGYCKKNEDGASECKVAAPTKAKKCRVPHEWCD